MKWVVLAGALAIACGSDAAAPDAAPPPDADTTDATPAVICGDGIVRGAEQCDDGNNVATDGCIDCALATCGDGFVRAGIEDCDDASPECQFCMSCTGATDPATGHCFTFNPDLLTRGSAADACGLAGGHLAIIEGEAEWAAVTPIWLDPFPPAWIGLTRAADGQDLWRWDSGEPLVTRRFQPTEPNDQDGIEDCVDAATADGLWNDLPCDALRGSLCEREPWSVDPTTGRAYQVQYRRRTWVEATNDCVARDAHLLSITSQAEQDFVDSIPHPDVWLGGFQGPLEGPFNWVTSEPFDYEHFADNQPDDFEGREDCLHMRPDGLWNDLPCDVRLTYICERDL